MMSQLVKRDLRERHIIRFRSLAHFLSVQENTGGGAGDLRSITSSKFAVFKDGDGTAGVDLPNSFYSWPDVRRYLRFRVEPRSVSF